ncbi:ABC transporter family substrate-binding protein [Corynebacterium heidelbergense]|uniref:ABC transporter substrate-binding protein n=1 Tax=Corynebacterium heidelbergense TaxID=2055947 RepID=A0A364V7V7_9CORY|nr:ABC transporter family substrate-binding protein [Corynebacterium heidelbergense]RAV32698.1 ABC transporter substrate-binding protein [Corynebacterium heidelbergense]WCZ36503.1 putative monoacyl phosphatidylinositol tetramannoside-binding protein LpqW precursor [Corynebacterium heidelbergense]
MKIPSTSPHARRWRSRSAVALTAAALLSLTACGGDSGKGDAIDAKSVAASDINPKSRDEIKDGGDLNLALEEIAEQQNIFHADGNLYTRQLWRMYNPQMSLFENEDYKPNPDYLTDVKSEDKDGKTVVTYTINDKAQYNDGTPIDWRAFENTWKANNGSNPDYKVSSTDGYILIESVKPGANDKQAVVTYKQEFPWWKSLFDTLVPPQVKDAETFNNAYLKQVHPGWGAGPFKVENVDFNGGRATFVRNEKWWGDQAKLDKVTYRQLEDQASMNAFQAGEIDAVGVATKDRLATARGMGEDKADIRTALRPSNFLITLNAKSPLLKDPAVREGIMQGIDRSQLAKIRFNGLDYSEKLPGSFLLLQNQKGYEDNFGAVMSYDQGKAKETLDKAGWKPGPDGIREKDGQKLAPRYVLQGDDPQLKAEASATQKMMRDIGVDMQIDQRPTSDFSKITKQRDFDIFPMGFNLGDPFGVAYFAQLYGTNGGLNLSGTDTAEMDRKAAEISKIGNPEEQIKKANEAEREALRAYGLMPTFNGPTIMATKPALANSGAAGFTVVPIEDIGWQK